MKISFSFIFSLLYINSSNSHKIAFGSCNNAHLESLFDVIESFNIDKLLLLGDTIYLDDKRYNHLLPSEKLINGYSLFKQDLSWKSLFIKLNGWNNIHAVYDDHDYGYDNADKFNPFKELSMDSFYNFTDIPHNNQLDTSSITKSHNSDSRKRRATGVYSSYTHTFQQINHTFIYKTILLDLRSNKDDSHNSEGDFLGQEQWQWLVDELSDSYIYDMIIIGSSLQVLRTDGIVEESWNIFPIQRIKHMNILSFISIYTNVLILSGDIHQAEVSQAICTPLPISSHFSTVPVIRTLLEITSSGFTHTFSPIARLKDGTGLVPGPENCRVSGGVTDSGSSSSGSGSSRMKCISYLKNFIMNYYQVSYKYN